MRTRTDVETKEARANNFYRRDMAFQSGSQLLSTDYPICNPSHSLDYYVSFDRNRKVRCNPQINQNYCSEIDLDE